MRKATTSETDRGTQEKGFLKIGGGRFRRQSSAPVLAAHSAVVTLCLAVIAYFVFWAAGPSSYETDVGEYRIARLADGSHMHLNGTTTVRVHFGDRERRVELSSGQALFDVAHDEHRPFRVIVGNTVAQALGTQFDVRLQENELHVAVKQGQVAVNTAGDGGIGDTVVAHQSELARVNLATSQINVRRLTKDEKRTVFSWVGTLAMNGMTLQEAVDRFNASNTSQIRIDDPSIALTRMGGIFSLLDADGFVAALRSLGITSSIETEDDRPVIHLKGRTSDETQKPAAAFVESDP